MPFQIETERLVLREWQTADRAPFRQIATDPQVMRFISDGTPWSDARIVAITHPQNLRSQAVMKRLGMRFERETTGRELGLQVPDVDIVFYARERCDT